MRVGVHGTDINPEKSIAATRLSVIGFEPIPGLASQLSAVCTGFPPRLETCQLPRR